MKCVTEYEHHDRILYRNPEQYVVHLSTVCIVYPRCTPVAAGDSKNWGGQEENQHGILQQTTSNCIIVPPDEIRDGGQFYMPIKQLA